MALRCIRSIEFPDRPRNSWVGKTWRLLQLYGLENLYEDGAEVEHDFDVVPIVRQHQQQLWLQRTLDQPKLQWLRSVKPDLDRSLFLKFSLQEQARRDLIALRACCFPIRIEYERYAAKRIERAQRLCPLCWCGDVEDESHFLLQCRTLQFVRDRHAKLFRLMDLAQLCNTDHRLRAVLAEDAALNCMAEKLTELRQDSEWRPPSMKSHSYRATAWSIRRNEDAWDFFQSDFLIEAFQLIEAFIVDLCQTRRGLRSFDKAVCAWFRINENQST